MALFHNKSLVEKKGDEVVIRENVNNIDKRFEEDKNTELKKWDFLRFPYGRDYKYGWKPNGSTELSLKFPVPGCKVGGFSKIFNGYGTPLKERLINNNGNHDAMISPNWNWVDWNYGEKSGRKRGMKVAIITHFAKMQQIDTFPALLSKRKDFGYSLGSQTDHDLWYVSMNWKREMEKN